jgi:hypothetical protein
MTELQVPFDLKILQLHLDISKHDTEVWCTPDAKIDTDFKLKQLAKVANHTDATEME